MNSLDQSDELIQRGAELRAQSVRARAAADEKMEKSRRLIAASAQTKVVIRAPILEADRPTGLVQAEPIRRPESRYESVKALTAAVTATPRDAESPFPGK